MIAWRLRKLPAGRPAGRPRGAAVAVVIRGRSRRCRPRGDAETGAGRMGQPRTDGEKTVQFPPALMARTRQAIRLPRVEGPPVVNVRFVAPAMSFSGCGIAWIGWPLKRAMPPSVWDAGTAPPGPR